MVTGFEKFKEYFSGFEGMYTLIGGVACELLMDDTEELTFVVSNMENTRKERYSMTLPGLPKRPPKATRLHLHLEFESANRCKIDVEDMGFGEMYPSSGLKWQETMVG